MKKLFSKHKMFLKSPKVEEKEEELIKSPIPNKKGSTSLTNFFRDKKRFNSPEESESKKSDIIKKIYISKNYKYKESKDNIEQQPNNEISKIPKKIVKKDEEREKTELADKEDKDELFVNNNNKNIIDGTNINNSLLKRKSRIFFGKKKNINIKIYSNNNTDESDNENNINKKNYRHKYSDTFSSNLSEAMLKGIPTKIKIFKCVVWKNDDPTVSEDTIKHILRRSGSQILEKGGFVVKLPNEKIKKLNQVFL